jgi:hypothetical protein
MTSPVDPMDPWSADVPPVPVAPPSVPAGPPVEPPADLPPAPDRRQTWADDPLPQLRPLLEEQP